jgi:RNA polymerase sigma-70 factor (ECF subfamily)
MERTLISQTRSIGGAIDTEAREDFDSLARVHWPRVFRFVLASVRDRESAENLTQECFVRAYKAREQFRGASSFATWLMQIAANLVRSHEGNTRLNFWRRAFRSTVDVSAMHEGIPDNQVSPEASALEREQIEAVWKAVTDLSGRQREVFLLRFVEDLDIAEIAEVTGMKEGTVKVHLFRALRTVRHRVGGRK